MAGEENIDILTSAATDAAKLTPSVQGSGTSFGPTPLVQPPPPARFEPPQIQHAQAGNEFSTASGNKRATKQALFHSVASTIKAGGDYIQAKKTRALSMDIGRLMEAQQGLQEAQAALQQNPNDPTAKEAMQRNTALINDITSDPKKVKQLQKAFNIDLFGNGKNKQENAALVDAWKEFGKKQAAGDKTALNPNARKMMEQQPQRQQIDPALQQQAAMIKMGLLPDAKAKLTANMEVFKAYSAAQTSEARNAAIVKAAEIHAATNDARTRALIDMSNQRIGGVKYAADVKYRGEKLRAATMIKDTQLRVDAMRDVSAGKNQVLEDRIKSQEKIANDKNATNQDRMKALQELNRIKSGQSIMGGMAKQAEQYNKTLKTLTDDNDKLEKELGQKKSGFIDVIFGGHADADKKRIAQNIGRNNAMIKDITGSLEQLQQRMDGINKAALGNSISLASQPAEGNTSGDGSSADTAIDFNPEEGGGDN